MDMKEVVQTVRDKADEALNAYHAGHHDNADNYLGEIRTVIQAHFGELGEWGGNVPGSPTSEKAAEVTDEKPAEVPGAPAQPAQTPGAQAALGTGDVQPFEKPAQ